MKREKFGFMLLIACFLFSVFAPTATNAGNYLGELCWNFTSTTHESSGVCRLGVEHMGDGHFLCSGKVTVKGPASHTIPVFGNIETVDGKIAITLTIPGRRDGNLGSEMIYVSLDSNLNGTIESIGIYSDEIEAWQGTATYTACP